MSAAFDRLHSALRHHIVNSLGWRELRAVQEESIDATLDGANSVVLAPTAGGKTEAAFFPLISQALEDGWSGLCVLYVSPIKALLNNQEERLRRYYELLGRRASVWHGDTSAAQRKRILAEPPDCLLTTPESIEVMLVSRSVPHEMLLRNLRAIVVDEVHAFAGDDRGWHLLSLLARLGRLAGRDIQRIGLSATVGNPADLARWLSAGSGRPQRLIRPDAAPAASPGAAAPAGTPRPPDAAVQLDFVGTLTNAARVIHALHRGEKRLVFVDSRARVESLAADLRQLGTRTFVSHSSLGVDERRQAEQAFAQGQDCVIVATSALELGIDVGDLDRVVQVDAQATVSSFLQRMGRTGRRPGSLRNCTFLATSDETLLRAAAIIELWRRGFVEPVVPPPEPVHVLAQQLMAMALQEEGGIGRSEWLETLRPVPPFAEATPEPAGEILAWMLREHILFEEEGVLWLGTKGEDHYGRRNWMELFAVFASPPVFKVLHGRSEVGSVHQMSLIPQNRDPGPVVLLLGGRGWKAREIDWRRRVVHVESTREKGRSRWQGQGQLLSREVCRTVQEILASSEHREGWTRRARDAFDAVREDYAWLQSAGRAVWRVTEEGEPEWWTFAGGKANAALARALEEQLGARVTWDNFAVRVKGGARAKRIEEAVRALREMPPEELRPEIDERALEGLKFQECLPPRLAIHVLEERLADEEAVREALG